MKRRLVWLGVVGVLLGCASATGPCGHAQGAFTNYPDVVADSLYDHGDTVYVSMCL